MDHHFTWNGASYVWNEGKALRNIAEHDGVTFEEAAEVLFDPFVRILDASRHEEGRDGAIGYSTRSRLLFVVHMVIEDETIRIISAWKATTSEREIYDS